MCNYLQTLVSVSHPNFGFLVFLEVISEGRFQANSIYVSIDELFYVLSTQVLRHVWLPKPELAILCRL